MELRKLDERDQMTAALQFVQNSGKAHRESLELIALKESRTEDPTKNLQVTFDQLEVRAGPPATDASGPPLPPPQPSTKNFYGFLDAADNRYKASSIDEATEYFKMGLAMDRKFDNERECDLWVASGAALQRWKKQSSPGAAPGSPAKSPLGATTPKRGNLAGPGSVLLETDDVVSLSESSATTLEDERKSGSKGRHGKDHKNKDSRRRRHKDKKTGKRGKDRKKGKGRGRRHGRRRRGSGDYDSDPSSSGSSSSSSKSPYDGWSSSSDKDSDDSRAYKRSERRKRIKKRSKQSRNSSRHMLGYDEI
ncbi:unnamed protein product [Cylindrotheca closterium]|nr:unnamed protein product [Cylindrotheca closterium]